MKTLQSIHLPAYFYPSRIFMVDDNRDFLTNFSLQLDPDLAYCIFSSPHEAMRQLLQNEAVNNVSGRILSLYQEGTRNPITNHTVNLDLAPIQNEVFNKYRFDEISVVVVDYDMPGLNGLDFCQRIKHLPVKKIMLTGKADEKLAIEAFNKGVINQFIAKQSFTIIEDINRSMRELQQLYFREMSNTIVSLLSLHNSSLLDDPIFINFFEEVCKKNNIVEYYITENTGSFLLLDIDAKPSWLVVKFYDDLKLYYELASDSGAGSQILEDLRSGAKIPYTYRSTDYYQLSKEDWQRQMYPASTLVGRETYYYAYIPYIKDFEERGSKIFSYHDYLASFDANSRK